MSYGTVAKAKSYMLGVAEAGVLTDQQIQGYLDDGDTNDLNPILIKQYALSDIANNDYVKILSAKNGALNCLKRFYEGNPASDLLPTITQLETEVSRALTMISTGELRL